MKAYINDLAAGKHLLRITNADTKCVRFDTLVISDEDGPQINHIATDPLCWGNSNGSIDFNSGGQTDVTLFINGKLVSGDDSVGNLKSGKYEIEIDKGANCKTYETISLIDPPKLIITNKQHTDVPCYGDSTGTITYTAQGGTGSYNYYVIAQDTADIPSGSISHLPSDLYDIYVEDVNHCKTKDTVEIVQPMQLTFDIDSVIHQACSDLPVGKFVLDGYGGTPPYTYSKDNGTTWTDKGKFTSLDSGLYFVAIKDANKCTYRDTAKIKRLTSLTVDYTTTLSLCKTPLGTAKVTPKDGQPPYSYLWVESGNTEDSISNQFAGIYKVIVKDVSGCGDTLNVRIDDVPGPEIDVLASEPSRCYHTDDGKLLIGISNGFAPYSLFINDTTYTSIYDKGVVVRNLKPGSYDVVVHDNYGCSMSRSITSTEPDSLTMDTIMMNPYCAASPGGQIHITGNGGTQPYQYAISSEPGRFVTGDFDSLMIGDYTIKIIDFNGYESAISAVIRSGAFRVNVSCNSQPLKSIIFTV